MRMNWKYLVVGASVLASVGGAQAMDAAAAKALAAKSACLACHAADKKLVGPAYKDVAKKYAGNAAAVAQLATKIQKGGSGVWGAIPMPANPGVNDADAKKLAQWVLGMK
jgi:cytochrome c